MGYAWLWLFTTFCFVALNNRYYLAIHPSPCPDILLLNIIRLLVVAFGSVAFNRIHEYQIFQAFVPHYGTLKVSTVNFWFEVSIRRLHRCTHDQSMGFSASFCRTFLWFPIHMWRDCPAFSVSDVVCQNNTYFTKTFSRRWNQSLEIFFLLIYPIIKQRTLNVSANASMSLPNVTQGQCL